MTGAEFAGGRDEAHQAITAAVQSGHIALGIELGSTRIKAVLVGPESTPIATGTHEWSNLLVDGVWTYGLEEVWTGVRDCYAQLAADVQERYGVPLTTIGSLGVSAMMHGYLAFDAAGELLVPYRTWRNTNTGGRGGRLRQRRAIRRGGAEGDRHRHHRRRVRPRHDGPVRRT